MKGQINTAFLKNNKRIFEYVICGILAYILRIIYCIKYPTPVRDALKYKTFIKEWINIGETPIIENNDLPPLYLYVVKEAHKIFGTEILETGVAINICLGVMIVLIIMGIGKELFKDNYYALIMGVAAASHPKLIAYSCQMLRENSYLLGVCAYLYYAVLLLKKKTCSFILVLGIVSGFTILCRHEGFELLLITVIVEAFLIIQKRIRIKDAFLMQGLYLITVFITIGILSYIMDIPAKYYISYKSQFKITTNKYIIQE